MNSDIRNFTSLPEDKAKKMIDLLIEAAVKKYPALIGVILVQPEIYDEYDTDKEVNLKLIMHENKEELNNIYWKLDDFIFDLFKETQLPFHYLSCDCLFNNAMTSYKSCDNYIVLYRK